MQVTSLSPGSADALLFDLGRVVLDIDFSKAIACWAGHAGCKPEAIVARYVRDSEAYRLHEMGKISDEDYFASLRALARNRHFGCAVPGRLERDLRR